MCGITGVIDRKRPVDPALLARLIGSLHRRGPDGQGHFLEGGVGLGMRRLAILDLEHGDQPFCTVDGGVVAFANGEIYNFRELREDLERRGAHFRTGCDAEVLPHAYRAYGAEGLAERLDGMFAAAIYDRERRQLHLMRDRFGEKPLFYLDQPDRFAFSSQLTSLLLLPDLSTQVDPTALRHYLALHFVPGPRTVFETIRRVPPGHQLSVDIDGGSSPRLRRWVREGPAPETRIHGYEEAVARVREGIQRAVRSRLVADVPVGIFLSGGVDSSAIAAAVARVGARPETFSIGFEDCELDESEHSRAVAKHIGSEHHHFQFGLDACLGVLEPAIEALDEPLGDPACLPVYLLSREARRSVTVALSGEGADELFAGYDYYPEVGDGAAATAVESLGRRRLQRLWDRTLRRPAAASPPFLRDDNTTPSGFPLLTSATDRDALVRTMACDEDAWLSSCSRRLSGERCALRRAQRADLETWLPDDLLPKFDHMTMAVSLEGRAPFLEPRLAQLALALPAHHKQLGDLRKRVLRDAVAPWLPEQILARRKQAFVLPMQRWLQGPLRERLLDSLTIDRDDGLDTSAARHLAVEDLEAGAARARLLYALLAYREWFEAVREGRTLAHRCAESAPPLPVQRAVASKA
jgi:asparagine synthase (glutamine-hydrolysing)